MSFYVCTHRHFSAGGGPEVRCMKQLLVATPGGASSGFYTWCGAERTEMEFEEWYNHSERNPKPFELSYDNPEIIT